MEEQQKLANSKEVLAFLVKEFPKCFSLEGEAKPLKIGIFHDLSQRLEGDARLSKRLLRMSLRHYTSSWKYLASIKAGAFRVDLDGVDGDAVELEHAEHAAAQLKESKSKAAEKRQELKKQSQEKKSYKNRANIPGKSSTKPSSKDKLRADKRPKPAAPKVKVRELLEDDLKVGVLVSVKVGSTPMPATITEVAKDGIHVQLNSGMTVKVQKAQLRLAL
ncbi:RNA chaperone ProQ [Glaciecola sp. MH2013]|uniref:RNA chaperone ProQ n=1 Tax=Glaciecola sp. MH2013 TaxID=2785524 RepID=UPI00189D0D57|nr:RNA chaperone ProQ [Glaciecola sp. MH2013]MBF7072786.1 RNA chaperone ProQ [Glaciecola sp. MH2013]